MTATLRFEADLIDVELLEASLASMTPPVFVEWRHLNVPKQVEPSALASTSKENNRVDKAILALFQKGHLLSRTRIMSILAHRAGADGPGWPESKIAPRIQRLVMKKKLVLVARGLYSLPGEGRPSAGG